MRKLILDICDYNDNPVCQLYDNSTQIIGQATDVHIRTERNGWKELSFSLPSVINTEEGTERNYRLDYLIADWRIRVIDDHETDWYIISEPKITHSALSQEVDVVAGHVSQLLKLKQMGLEFSDTEGNNIGTALELLTTILDGTGWFPGDVTMFMEDDDFSVEKRRSLVVAAKSGAFKMITDLCELFSAKAVFHGGTKTVDILPMNPFSHIIAYNNSTGRTLCGKIIDLNDGQIPTWATNNPVLELHYDKYLQGISRTINTENVYTKLTAYGSKNDTNLGMCSLQNATHKVFHFKLNSNVTAGDIISVSYLDDTRYYVAKTDLSEGTSLELNTLDPLSLSYLWDGTTAHRMYYGSINGISVIPTILTQRDDDVQNWFQYIFDFTHYDKTGLVTDEMIQRAAEFQHTAPSLIETSYNKNLAFSDVKTRLSEIGESNAGFLKLAINGWREASGGGVRLNIDNSQGKDQDGVLYRSDYAEQARKYFTWYVAEKLKEDGSSLDGIGSVVYAVKKRDSLPPLWRMMYLKIIDDRRDTRTDFSGKVVNKYANYVYATETERPKSITLWEDYEDFVNTFGSYTSSNNVEFFLFCANAMTGMLGALQSGDESIIDTLNSSTKVVTDPHPVVFLEKGKSFPNPTSITNTYAWVYEYYPNDYGSVGDLSFYCSGFFGGWMPVVITDDEPETVSGTGYLYNTRYKTLHRRTGSTWTKMETTEEKTMANNFAKVIYYSRKRDRMYKGLYEKYIYNIPSGGSLPAGNYAIKSDFYFCWVFTTQEIDGSIIGTEEISLPSVSFIKQDDLYVSAHIGLTPGAWYSYSFDEEYKVEKYSVKNRLMETVYMKGTGSFQANAISYVVLSRETQPTEGEFINCKRQCQLWLDTSSDTVYQEDDINTVVEAQAKSFDTVTFPPANMLSPDIFSSGSIDSNGLDVKADGMQKSQTIRIYPGVTYDYSLSGGSRIALYDGAKYLSRIITASGSGSFTVNANEEYMKVASSNTNGNVHVRDYKNVIFVSDKLYKFLDVETSGERKGINNLMELFVDTADEVYDDYLADMLVAQNAVKSKEQELSLIFGDLYRENWIDNDTYVKGDESKLYTDTLHNLRVVSRPEITYEIDFLDLYRTDEDEGLPYPDITMDYSIHMVDPDLKINLWAYIDDLDKCYDKSWLTKLKINTMLSDVSQHGFGDVMTYIADVTKVTHANQSIYARAANFSSDGSLNTSKLEGQISAAANKLSGGSSNWYTDSSGNIVIESQDGLHAMMLTGMGFMIANSKNKDGDWLWRSFGTGEGFLGDEITGGTINGVLIKAGSVSTNAVMSNFGEQLDIASNKSLLLYATVDGIQPAGGLETAHPGVSDSFIYIKAGDECTETNTLTDLQFTYDDITGLYTIRVDLTPNAWYTYSFLKKYTVNMYNENDELVETKELKDAGYFQAFDVSYLTLVRDSLPDAGDFINGNFSPARIDVASGGDLNLYSGSTLNIAAESNIHIRTGGTFTVDSQKFSIDEDGNVSMEGEVTASSGNIAGFTIRSTTNPRTGAITGGYIYKGTSYLSDTTPGIYLGTDGISVGGGKFKAEVSTGNVYVEGEIKATTGSIGGWKIDSNHIGDGTTYANSIVGISSLTGEGQYAFYAGKTATGANFSVTSTGSLVAKLGQVGGWYISDSHIGNDDEAADSTVGMASGTGQDIVFWAGNKKKDRADFYVMANGTLHATNATVSGNITANALAANTTITGAELIGGSIKIPNASAPLFEVDSDGNMTSGHALFNGGFWIQKTINNTSTIVFSVSDDGYVECRGGLFNGWAIYSDRLKRNDETIGFTKSRTGYWTLDSDYIDTYGVTAERYTVQRTNTTASLTFAKIDTSGNIVFDFTGATINGLSSSSLSNNSDLVKQSQLSNYATQTYVDNAVSGAISCTSVLSSGSGSFAGTVVNSAGITFSGSAGIWPTNGVYYLHNIKISSADVV